MSIRASIARWICPELGKAADRYHYLRGEIDESSRWLSYFPDASETLERLLELDRDHWRLLGEKAIGKLPSQISDFRKILDRRQTARYEENRKLRDIDYHLGIGANPDLLEQIADEIDCGPDCDNGWTESDTNAFNCRKIEEGTCGGCNAEELRQLAIAFRNRDAMAPAPASTITDMVEIVANAIGRQPLDRLIEADGPKHPHILAVARAAILAMKEPNKRMLRAAAKAMSPNNRPTPEFVSVQKKHAIRYRAMIDAALGEAEPPTKAAETEGSDA